MAPKKGQPKRITPAALGDLDPNRVVAFNVRKARIKKGLKQAEAAAALGWSAANWSNAERSVNAGTKRVRNFTVTDLHAFARLFDLPVLWFLIPPLPDELPEASALPEPTVDDVLALVDTSDLQHRMGLVWFQYPEMWDEVGSRLTNKPAPRKTAADIRRQAKMLAEDDAGQPGGWTAKEWEAQLQQANRY